MIDSASDIGDRRFFLCGYVNTVEKWRDFSATWQATLQASPPIEYFKMAEAQNLRDQFKDWLPLDRDKKVLSLAKVVRRYQPLSFECSVSREEYEKLLKPAAPYDLQGPYFGCFFGVITGLAQFLHAHGGRVPVDFIFDEQGGLGNDAALAYQWIKDGFKEGWADLLGASPIFRDDKLMLPLQAADMLAWHVRRDREGVDPPNSRPAMDFLRTSGMHILRDVDAATLASLARKMRLVPGVSRTQSRGSWRKVRKEMRKQIAAGLGPPSTNFVRMLLLNIVVGMKELAARLRGRR